LRKVVEVPGFVLPGIEDITRRDFLVGGAAALLLGGCGGSEEAAVRVESESGRARTVSHAFGETEVPKDPGRVLALGQEDMLADLLSIGVEPVASLSNLADSFPGLDPEETEGIEPILATGEVSLEQFTALSPDLIVGHAFFVEQAGYEELSRIAPTVAVAAEDTTATYLQTLAVFGEEETARRRVEEFEERVRRTGEELGAGGRTVSLATVYPGPNLAAWVDGPTPVPKLVLDLGFRLAPDRDEVEGLLAETLPGIFGLSEGRAYLSDEELVLFDGESLLLLQSSLVEGEEQALEEVRRKELWETLPAVENGRVSVLDRLGYPGFPSLGRLLEDLAEILKE
jgi:iron complex transport system substrate-binding protein